MNIFKVFLLNILYINTFLSILSAKYLLIDLNSEQQEKHEVTKSPEFVKSHDYDYQSDYFTIEKILRKMANKGKPGNSTKGYRNIKIRNNTKDGKESWRGFFAHHKVCDEKSEKCNYMDKCKPGKSNDPCQKVQFANLDNGTNIVCARPHEIGHCKKKAKENCGPSYYFFTDCNYENNSKATCFCLHDVVIRKAALKAVDECKDGSVCEYADFCLVDGNRDPCNKMGGVYVPNPEWEAKAGGVYVPHSERGKEPVYKSSMKCVSLTEKKVKGWDSPSCKDENDICSCQDSGIEKHKTRNKGLRKAQFYKRYTKDYTLRTILPTVI